MGLPQLPVFLKVQPVNKGTAEGRPLGRRVGVERAGRRDVVEGVKTWESVHSTCQAVA